MAKTYKDFINKYNGKVIDYDGVFGAQCVDGFKVFCNWAGYPVKATMTGWADGYWWYRTNQGWSKYFDFITDPRLLQAGDWLFWAYGSKSCRYSHVAMFTGYSNSTKTRGYIFGENQGGNRGFRTIDNPLDICGAFRPKLFKTTVPDTKAKAYITSLYKNILGRNPDTGGLNSWTKAIEQGQNPKYIVAGMFNSREYTNKKKNNSDFIKDCYKGYLFRSPDKNGLNGYITKLNRGTKRETILNSFGDSAEFKQLIKKKLG